MKRSIACIVLLMLCSCATKRIRIEQQPLSKEERARAYDIPFPLNSDPISIPAGQDQQVFSFQLHQPVEHISSFYDEHMVLSGWNKIAHVHSDDSILVYEKPRKICAILLRSSSDKIAVLISTTSKIIE